MKLTVILSALCICLFSVSCLKPNTYSCNFDACAVVAPAAEIKTVEDYLATRPTAKAVKHCSGMYYEIMQPGTGASVTRCDQVNVTYSLTQGKNDVFVESSTTPIALDLSQVIRGWQIGVPLLKEGGTIKLYVPPTLGYGASAAGNIPANTMLVFVVTLVSVVR